jgi:hypothetical protein
MRTCEESVRDRLREIAEELATLAVATHVPSEQAYAAALAAEAKRIERNAQAR